MGTTRAEIAMRRPTAVWLNLAELNRLLDAGLDAGGGSRKAPPDLRHAVTKIRHARDRRLRAVDRAQGN